MDHTPSPDQSPERETFPRIHLPPAEADGVHRTAEAGSRPLPDWEITAPPDNCDHRQPGVVQPLAADSRLHFCALCGERFKLEVFADPPWWGRLHYHALVIVAIAELVAIFHLARLYE